MKKKLKIKVLPPILESIIYSSDKKFNVPPCRETLKEDNTEEEKIIKEEEEKANQVREIPDDYFPGY